MALPSISTPKVKIVNKDLEAWIRLPALEEGEHYTIEYLHDVLRVNQITYGIDEAQLQKILDEEIYEQDVLVARGIPAVEGQDGFYEYKVNMNLEKKPKILPDGSVDYWSMIQCTVGSEGSGHCDISSGCKGNRWNRSFRKTDCRKGCQRTGSTSRNWFWTK